MTTAGTLLDLFNESVRTRRDRTAVSDDHDQLTYAELDTRSAALAASLRERSVGTEDRVGVVLDRSVDMFVAILGILRAGACYVAVDPRYPEARRDDMLLTAGCKLVVTRPESGPRLVHLGVDLLGLRGAPPAGHGARAADVEPTSAASVLFTSGSTGRPKAIVLEHRNLVSFARNAALPRLTPDDTVGQISSVSFDAFHFEMWTTLASGAHVVVLPAVPDLLAADFHREVRRRRISAMLVPTMVLNHIVREDRNAFASLRLLQAGGDVLIPSACRALLGGDFRGELYNLYGPAEITTACTARRVTAEDAASDSIPIGRPVEGTRIYVVTEDGGLAGPGESGEILVGGAAVARGYLDQPELTAERFVSNPFDDAPPRLYRTGDLGRWRPDGALEFVGRADGQVKIRGYRVEPGEVERGLRRHSDVSDAVVLPVGEGGDRHLEAVVVFNGTLTPRELRAFAEQALPDFMVPAQFIRVPEIPADEHGKRDHDALLELVSRHRRLRERYQPPGTPTETFLATLWSELLDVERVGAKDDFFDLGGHSLLAFRMHRRVQRELGVSLEFEIVLRNAVLADLAERIDEVREGGPLL